MTGGEAVAAQLAALGVKHVFGIVSVHNLPIADAITRTTDITFVTCRHEQGATHAADAYARASGGLGVVLTSTGPGAMNAIAGLYEAHFASSPVLMITGQIETRFYGKGKGFLHEAERQLETVRTVTKRAESVRRTEDIGRVIAAVAQDIQSGRPQPGAVEIPIDLQYREADVDVVRGVVPIAAELDQTALRAAAALLETAERPLVWAGGGVVSADASDELVALAEKLHAPVITTIEGRGAIPEDHPLALGPRTERGALSPIIAEADVVLAVGTRFQNYSTRMWQLAMPGALIHLDADPAVIGRNYPARVALVGDARDGLAALAKMLDDRRANEEFLARARDAVAADLEATRKEIGPDHWKIAATLRRLLPRDANIVRDATVAGYLWGNRILQVYRPRTSFRAASLAIGPGVPLALGAAVATGRPTVVIQGDGGLMLSIGELVTLAEHHLPVIVLVFNDRGYGVLRTIQDHVMPKRTGVDLFTPDFVAVAKGMGLAAEAVVGLDAFEPALEAARHRDGPTLLDIDLGALAPMTFPLPPHQQRR